MPISELPFIHLNLQYICKQKKKKKKKKKEKPHKTPEICLVILHSVRVYIAGVTWKEKGGWLTH